MGNNRKRIGIFTSQPECAYQSQFLKGFLSEAFRNDYDVAIIATFLRTGCSEQFQHGEMDIYNVTNFELFDGIAILPDMLSIEGLATSLLERLKKEYHGPVVVVDFRNDDYPCVLNDDDNGIQAIVEHLITQHNCRDIAFMSGPKEHYHAELRLSGYQNAMKAHNLPIRENRIFYGDFWYDKGLEVVDALLADPACKLPDAICCASDTMALSVMDACATRNLCVPEDIIVTGYDADGDGIRKYHHVTSLPRRNTMLGRNAMCALHGEITGTEYTITYEPYNSYDLITSSCGCDKVFPNLNHSEAAQYHTVYDYTGFESGFNFMLEDMIGAPDLNECLWILMWYTYLLGDFEGFYLCLCDHWCAPSNNQNLRQQTNGYSDSMILALEKTKEEQIVNLQRTFSLKDMLPAFLEERPKPSAFYFSPLHFNDSCIGYSVLNLGDSVDPYGIYFSKWSRNVNNALESIRRQADLKYMCDLIEHEAETDSLTGLYNRKGFYTYSTRLLKKAAEEKLDFMVLTGDLNCMKYINDTYGHIEGDLALQLVSRALVEATKEDGGFHFRTGGDEFVYISTGSYSTEYLDGLVQTIRTRLNDLVTSEGKPYPLYLGFGYSFGKVSDGDTVDLFLSRADSFMFSDKEKVKEQTGFRFSRL